jgi:uncharacterized membrane protein YfhO
VIHFTRWTATVNGKPVFIERAYLAFKAVNISKGSNVVIFTYGSTFKVFAYFTLAILLELLHLSY